MAQTPAQIRYWTQYLVGDPQMSTYSQQMYTDAINFAVKDYAIKTGATYREDSVTPSIAGICTIPSTHLRIQRVAFNVGGTALSELVESTFDFESMKSPIWQSLTQATAGYPPKRWIKWSGLQVKLTPIPSPVYTATIGYVESPALMSEATTTAGAFTVGKTYQIATVGTTDFTLIGATANTVGLNFVATGVGAGTGTAIDVIDLRIPDSHNEFLKYAAGAWLLQIDGDGQDLQTANAHMEKFNTLIGYSDNVLTDDIKRTRNQAEREV